MADMTVDEAYKTLGIVKDATLRDATKAYHELSKDMHPDTSGQGSVDDQARLNEAHEVVVANLQRGSAGDLVPVEVKQAVQVLERGIARQVASREIEAVVKRLTNRRIRPIQSMKYMAFLFAGFAAFFGWLSNDVGIGIAFDPEMLKMSKLMAVMLGTIGGTMQFLVQHQTHMVESFRDMMSDEEQCAAFLSASGVKPEDSFTISDLRNDENRGGHHSFFTPGSILSLNRRERINLALLKGVEIGIIEHPANSRLRYQVTAEARPMFD